MKKVSVFLVLFCFLFSLPVFAQESNYLASAAVKAKHGVINTLTGWLELPFQIMKGFESGIGEQGNNKLLGGVAGILRGVFHGIGRTASGILELTTCVLPNPSDNEGIGIPLDSEYAWEKGSPYSIHKQGVVPVGEKLVRGVVNTIAGIVEMPGQLNKATQENTALAIIKGIGKAVIYPVSRIISGVFDLITFPLPNDSKQHGPAFDEEQPWDALKNHPFDRENPPEGYGAFTSPVEPLPVPDFYIMQMFSP
ncbi:MAG: exosortase system-associated protein, TIGR04073 family [Candidatus Omnitrophota bacterium]